MDLFNGSRAFFSSRPQLQKGVFIIVSLLCISSLVSPPLALVLGFLVAELVENPFMATTKKMTTVLLQVSVVGLGFGMNINSALRAGSEGFIFTIVSIVSIMLLGTFLTKAFKIDRAIGYLISSGTAICGGSAIAAISPIIKAKPNQISVALAVVFILNSVALLIFPYIGQVLNLTQQEFGLWSAIAIHDTSSVVGAASKYGDEALQVATTVKLARALWIIPLSFVTVLLFKNKETRVKIPWFIAFFIAAMCLNTFVPFVQTISAPIVLISKAGLTFTLFLIGTGFSVKVIKSLGAKPLILALALWFFISIVSLLVIMR